MIKGREWVQLEEDTFAMEIEGMGVVLRCHVRGTKERSIGLTFIPGAGIGLLKQGDHKLPVIVKAGSGKTYVEDDHDPLGFNQF